MYDVLNGVVFGICRYLVGVLELNVLTRYIFNERIKEKRNEKLQVFHLVMVCIIVGLVFQGVSLNMMSVIIGGILLLYIFAEYQNIWIAILGYLIITMLDLVIGVFLVWTLELKYQNIKIEYNVLLLVGLVALVMLCSISFVMRKNENKMDVSDYKLGNILFLGVFSSGIPLMYAFLHEEEIRLRGQVIIGVLLIIIVGLIWFRRYKMEQLEKISYQQALYLQQENFQQQKDYYEKLLKKEEDTKKFRHDIRQQLSCMYELEADEVHVYLGKLLERMEHLPKVIQTGNHIVNIVVNDVLGNTDIKVNWKGFIPDALTIEDDEVCVIFSNIFQNAKEAQDEIEEKEIWVEIKTYEEHMIVSVRNPYTKSIQEKNGIIISTKKYKNNHGYGIQNVKNIVEKYNGKVKYEAKDHMFTMILTLQNVVERK